MNTELIDELQRFIAFLRLALSLQQVIKNYLKIAFINLVKNKFYTAINIIGLAVGLGALLALVSGRLRIASVLSVLAALASPVAGLFLGVAGGALFLSNRRRDGLTLAVSGLVPTIGVGLVFGNGGRQSFGEEHALLGFLLCLLVAGLCWRRPVLRWGALLTAGLIAAAYFLPTPVGTTATRLPELFAAPR